MVTKNSISHVQRQEQRITSSLIQSLNMLSLPTQAMYDYLVELSMENPMLDIPEVPFYDCQETQTDEYVSRTAIERGTDPGYFEAGHVNTADQNEEFDPYYSRSVGFEADDLIGSLKLQLSMTHLSGVEKAIGQEIIGNLDDSGYFTGNLTTICLLYNQPVAVGEKVLRVVQSFQPRGIAAENVYEALCIQVEPDFPYAELAKKIIRNDLRAICDSSLKESAQRYGTTPEIIGQTFDYIRMLEPRPGNCDSCQIQIQYITPDITVQNVDDEMRITLYGETNNPLRLNEYYLDLLHKTKLSAEEKLYLRQNLNAARALIHSVDVRRQTLHKAALSLVTLQKEFFLHGPTALHPLTMQRLAEEMGVNVSTVSRVVQDKYVSTSWGIFPLKYFFVRALNGTTEGLSVEHAKKRMEELIETESSSQPLTDDDISGILVREGFQISRRTISKYRQEAGIPGYAKRKRKG